MIYKQVKYLFLLLSTVSFHSLLAQNFCERAGISNGWMLHLNDQEVDQITAAVAQTKALYFRADFAWSDVQYEGSDVWNWSNVDRVVSSALAEDLELIAILDYFPPWANAQSDTIFWSQYVYQAGLRYIPQGVKIWEMWNEPNITNFWEQPNAKDYVEKILIPGANAIRRASADLAIPVTVLSAGLAPAATDGTNISQIDFFRGIYEHGGQDFFDAAGQHPYCWPLDPSIENPYNWFLKTIDLRQVMIEYGDAEKKIWGTEMGWPTHSGNNGVSLEEQASFLTSAYTLWEAWDWTGPLIWYAYNDAGDDLSYSEDNFGLVDYNFEPKPALDSFLLVIENCTVISHLDNVDHSVEHVELFPNPAHNIINVQSNLTELDIVLYSAEGSLQKKFIGIPNATHIDLATYDPGLYFAVVFSNDRWIKTVRFTIQRSN